MTLPYPKHRTLSPNEEKLIQKAYEYTVSAHQGQMRKSGEPYANHCLETAKTIAEWKLDTEVIVAALLHDTVEDTSKTLEEVKKEFGEEIAFLVDGVTKLGHFKYREQNKEWALEKNRSENFRKLILALSEDIRVVFIKLADRLHNMKTLSFLPSEKQKRIALETYDVYASLAYRLGMTKLAGEMEDLSLPYLHPEDYKWLLEHVPEQFEEREEYLKKVKEKLEKHLRENNISAVSVSFRAKRYSSIYKKLKKYEMNLDQIYDLVAMRVIVQTTEDCYKTLGLIHELWKPLPGKIKDYIALPKPNNYRSIHTTVFCEEDKITEFQIRTNKMNEEAEHGIAAHWAYELKKESKSYANRKAVFADKKEIAWIKQLKNWQEKEGQSEEEFFDALKIDFFKDRIFAVTPKGDVIDLPHGATPIDFAYHIHSGVGNQAVGAKVNGKIAPLSRELKSGDIVEIMIQKGKKPSEDWLKFTKTTIARDHIKSELRKGSLLHRFNLKKKN
ncbi:hypothetical protein A3A21_01235 [Candidatus Jorgensenbacteria bacterium RIFCSPLOWO2_01_FULL_45_25b]|uniref:TGS domain-containing protein n=1 Tax=Candidatus Jorgensenbacteria bacterium RIFCSPLOWO2_01_FULL_45_25b TaxID=1798471 RepID=A0A1F6BVX1_9BACT|nr:MAG: hypothetical protein A3A21_01235 [Candidatus Jorgensenbacteria bacterium RIFCSPLOWO2_01_FULL_45_25b]